jgi:hypothetical protein
MAYTIIAAFVETRQERGEFKTSLGYLVRPYLKTNKQARTNSIYFPHLGTKSTVIKAFG